jgi:hypothetical protein
MHRAIRVIQNKHGSLYLKDNVIFWYSPRSFVLPDDAKLIATADEEDDILINRLHNLFHEIKDLTFVKLTS